MDLSHAETRRRVRDLREQGNLDGAIAVLDKSIHQNALELADIFGMLGGTRRDQGDLAAAAAAYDKGHKIDVEYGTLSTYNALNRVITRVLLAPGALADPEVLRNEPRLEFVNVCGELAKLETELESYIDNKRSDDYWAMADLAMVAALNGHQQKATDAVDRFASCSPPELAYATFRKALTALAQLDTPRRGILETVLDRLDRGAR